MFKEVYIFVAGATPQIITETIYALLRKYRHDFLYGNLMADIIIGKKFLPKDKNPHSWDTALNLLESAKTPQQRAFVYGYMSHLAADTVAHGRFMGNRKNIGHTLVELRADSIIDRKYWLQAMSIGQKRPAEKRCLSRKVTRQPYLLIQDEQEDIQGYALPVMF